MNSSRMRLISCALVALAGPPAFAGAAESPLSNVVMLYADDMGRPVGERRRSDRVQSRSSLAVRLGRAVLVLFAAAALSGRCPGATPDDWSHWRGGLRNGVVTTTSGWNGRTWIRAQPLWTTHVGEGASSPLAVGDRIFALGHREGRDEVSCLDARTGSVSWTVSYSTSKYGRNATGDEGLYSGPSSTPEYDPDTQLLYTLSADGDLHCWDARRNGARVWRINLYDEYRMPRRAKVGRSGRRDYGYTSAPLVYGDWLLVEVGGPDGTVAAFDKRTGKEIWRSEAKFVAGHSGGMAPLNVDGVPCIAVMTFDGLLVVRLDAGQAGRTVATYPWITDFANNIAGPAVFEDSVLITSAYNHQALCRLRITMQGAEKVWEQPFASKACTPVIYKGRIYLAWNRLRALDWHTGELLWEGPVVGDAGSCAVTADEKLVVWAGRGELFLADIARDESNFRELARVGKLAKTDVWPHVVVAPGRILCRDRQGNLMCFSGNEASR